MHTYTHTHALTHAHTHIHTHTNTHTHTHRHAHSRMHARTGILKAKKRSILSTTDHVHTTVEATGRCRPAHVLYTYLVHSSSGNSSTLDSKTSAIKVMGTT
eukprot:TRINITY_DN8475_c1_g1_i1.p2 TRINITY_DN8475_c1_g1~~TRINITY_DN8475_c1_g1_i1.p2  ORF type:complete len:101 (-),score=12.68 TRINITY_DN8475_c1_g1_i1:23-325(-)